MNDSELKNSDTYKGGDSGRGSYLRDKVRDQRADKSGAARLPQRARTVNLSTSAIPFFRAQFAFLVDTLVRIEMLVSHSGQRIAYQPTRHLKRTPKIRFFLPCFSAKCLCFGSRLAHVSLIPAPRLVRLAFASRMPAAAVNVGSFFHRLTCSAAILFGSGTGTIRVCALFIGSHLYPPF